MQNKMYNWDAVLWGAAAAALAAGLLWTARNAAVLPARVEALRARAAVWDRLRAVETEQADARRQLAALNDLPRPARAAPLAQLAAEFTPAARPEILDRGAQTLADGWRARRMELQYSEADLETVGAMLAAAAGQRPPWTLRSCKIEASSRQAGYGRVILQLEALERD